MGSLALAGAVEGAGRGLVANADIQQKVAAQKAAADYETTRQMALERMRSENAQQIEQQRAGAQMGVAKLQQQWHTEDVQKEVEAKASESSKQREFQGKENEANRQNRKDIATIRASAQIGARAGSAKPPKDWTFRNVTQQPSIDPVTKALVPGKQYSVLQNRDGRQFVQAGDKFMPYDASMDSVPDPGSVRRAASSEVEKLVQNPDQADNFLATYHYLPMQWFSAAQKQSDKSNAVKGWGRNAIPAGARVSGPAYLMGGEAAEDAADDAESDREDAQSAQQ